MAAHSVVILFDVVEKVVRRFGAGGVAAAGLGQSHAFAFVGGVKTFHRRIIIRIAFAAHARHAARLFQLLPIIAARVLHAAHHGAAGILEKVDRRRRLCRRVEPSGKTKTPDRHDRSAFVPEITRAVGDVHRVGEKIPVVRKRVDERVRRLTRDVIHDGEHATVSFSAELHVGCDLIAQCEEGRIGKFRGEPLEKHAIKIVFLHPSEMAQHRLLFGC